MNTRLDDQPPALEDPATQRFLGTYRAHAWMVLVGGVALLIGFSMAITAVDARDSRLRRVGIQVPGYVTHYDRGSRLISEKISIQFTWRGALRSAVVQLDDSSPRYEVGEPVTVLVDPDDDGHFTIEGEENQPAWEVWLMVGALLGGPLGVGGGATSLVRVRRQRRLLSAEPWRRVRVRYVELRGAGSIRPLVLIDDGGTPRVLVLAGVLRTRLRKTGLRSAATADVVGDLSHYAVLRAEGSATVVSVRSPWTERARRRWMRAFGR